MNHTRYIFAGSVLTLLSGCQVIPTISPDGSPYYSAIPIGSTLILRQTLRVPAERVRADLPRYGAAAAAGEYAPACSLELWTRNPQAVLITPDRFTITRISGGITPILVSVPATGVMVASYGYQPRIGWDRDDSSMLRSYAQLYLKSDRQADVYRLNCAVISDAWEVESLTVAEIRQATGSVMQLELASPPADYKESSTKANIRGNSAAVE